MYLGSAVMKLKSTNMPCSAIRLYLHLQADYTRSCSILHNENIVSAIRHKTCIIPVGE
jgi:hypothetical protein